jgi:hypothetical protein
MYIACLVSGQHTFANNHPNMMLLISEVQVYFEGEAIISQVFHVQNMFSLTSSITTKVAVISLSTLTLHEMNIRTIFVQKSSENVSKAFPCPSWQC